MEQNTKPSNPPAFNTPKYNKETGAQNGFDEGMGLRDYFAAKAMIPHLEHLMRNPVNEEEYAAEIKEVAHRSYAIADAMLKAREVTNG